MGGNSKSRHINAHNPNAVDLVGQKPQRHTRCCWNAQIGNHDRVIAFGVGHIMDSLADILEKLTSNERFGIERHIANRAPRTVEMAHEGKPIDATGRSAENGGCATHPQTHTKRAKSGTHALGFVMRALGVILGILIKDFGFACHAGSLFHLACARMATHAIDAHGLHRRIRCVAVLAEDNLGVGCGIVSDFFSHLFMPRRK